MSIPYTEEVHPSYARGEIVYPSVDRINPILILRTTRIAYTVISDNYFNARQKAALTQALEAAFTDVTVKVNLRTDRTYRGPENALAVEVEPMDSLGGSGSFKVFETLRHTLHPRRPHAAAGYWMRRAPTPMGTYVLGPSVSWGDAPSCQKANERAEASS